MHEPTPLDRERADLPPAAIVIDRSGRIEAADPAVEGILGAAPEQLLGTPLAQRLCKPSRGVFAGLLRPLPTRTAAWSALWFKARERTVRCLVRVVPVHEADRNALRLELLPAQEDPGESGSGAGPGSLGGSG